MLTIMQFESLDALLSECGTVLGLYQRRDPGFESAAADCLERIEGELSNNRLSLSARVAVARADLAAGHRMRSSRTERLARSVAALSTVIHELNSELAPTKARLADASAIARQTLAIGVGTGLLPEPDIARTLSPQTALALLRQDRNTAGGAIQLAGLVGPHDSLVTIGRGLAEL